MIYELLKDLNNDCNFTENINESKYTENINLNFIEENREYNKEYNNIIELIISEFDIIYKNTNDIDKQFLMNKIITDISTELDEKKEEIYNKYKLNVKTMKSSIIQYGLQNYKENNSISSILYLNEYYKKHFIIIHGNYAMKTSLKNYDKIYILYKNNKFSVLKDIDINYNFHSIKDFTYLVEDIYDDIKKDINKIYNISELKSLSNYKIDDLKKLCINYKLNSNKKKNELYNDLFIYLLNNLD